MKIFVISLIWLLRIVVFLDNCFALMVFLACAAMPRERVSSSDWSLILFLAYFGGQALVALIPIRKIHESKSMTYILIAVTSPLAIWWLAVVIALHSSRYNHHSVGSYVFDCLFALPSLIPVLLFLEGRRYRCAMLTNIVHGVSN